MTLCVQDLRSLPWWIFRLLSSGMWLLSVLDSCQHFRETYCPLLQDWSKNRVSTFIGNIGNIQQTVWCDITEYNSFNFYILLTIHSICVCRMRQFPAVLRSFFHSSLLCTFSCHPSPPTILPSSLTSSCHLFLGLYLNLVVPRFIYNTLLGILFSSILCTYLSQHNLFNLIIL